MSKKSCVLTKAAPTPLFASVARASEKMSWHFHNAVQVRPFMFAYTSQATRVNLSGCSRLSGKDIAEQRGEADYTEAPATSTSNKGGLRIQPMFANGREGRKGRRSNFGSSPRQHGLGMGNFWER